MRFKLSVSVNAGIVSSSYFIFFSSQIQSDILPIVSEANQDQNTQFLAISDLKFICVFALYLIGYFVLMNSKPLPHQVLTHIKGSSDPLKLTENSVSNTLLGRSGKPPSSITNGKQSQDHPTADTLTIKTLERRIKILRGCNLLLNAEVKRADKARAFERLRTAKQCFDQENMEELIQQEEQQFQNTIHLTTLDIHRNFIKNLHEKIELDRQVQFETVTNLKTSFYQMQDDYKSGISAITGLFQKLQYNRLSETFQTISTYAQNKIQGRELQVRKNYMICQIEIFFERKMRQINSVGFKKIKKMADYNSRGLPGKFQLSMKTKGKLLLNCIQKNSTMGLKKAFWKWYLTKTPAGQNTLVKTVDHLALYSNICLNTALYRFKKLIRKQKAKTVDIKTRRIGLVLFFLIKSAAIRRLREGFNKVKQTRKIEKQNVAKRIIEISLIKKRLIMERWRKVKEKGDYVKRRKEEITRKMLKTEVGKIFMAFNNIRNLPNRIKQKKEKQGNIFEKGLDKWITDKLKYAFDQFKLEKEYGNVLKKRGIVVIAKTTQSKIRKTYDRWYEIAKKNQLVTQCKLITTTFSSLNWVIKSITDNILVNVLHKSQKEGALDKLFKNMHLNLNDTFRKWRNTNMIEKLKSKEKVKSKTDVAQRILRVWKLSKLDSFNKWRQINQVRGLQQRITIHQKGNLIKLLNGLMEHNKINCLRQMIGRFRIHRNVVMIKRHFMKKLLTSRCGLVVTAFRKIQALPHRRGKTDYKEANKFEKGLDKWITDKLKYAFDQFKLEKEYGNVLKKRGIVVIAKTTQSKIRKTYDRWYEIAKKNQLVTQCKLITTTFSSLNWVIKSITDNILVNVLHKSQKEGALDKLFKNMHLNLNDTFRKWRNTNMIEKLKSKEKVKSKTDVAQRILRVWKLSKLDSFNKWRQINQVRGLQQRITIHQKGNLIKLLNGLMEHNKINCLRQMIGRFRIHRNVVMIKRHFMKKLLTSRCGLVVTAFRKIQALPHRRGKTDYKEANKFEKGLDKWITDKLKYAFDQFKLEKEYGNVLKKRGIVVIAKTTQSKIRKTYDRWYEIAKKNQLVTQCKLITTTFSSLNWVIKSITDNILVNVLHKSQKEGALDKLFKNMHLNLNDTFRKWRNTNMIEKLKSKEKVKSKTDVAQRILRVWKLSKLDSFNKWRQINQVRGLQQRITIHQKGNLIKLLNGLMEHNKINCLRQMIGRFRIHRNVVMIKRHFMKKLLTSRCGLVVTAFRKIQALPHRRGKTDYKEANKFEKGLDKWITDKLKYAFDQFKLEKEYGNVLKKRGIVVIAKTTQSKIRKTYDRWYEIAKKNQLVTQCKLITTTFSSLNWVIKSITDNILVNVLHKSQKEGALDKLFKNMHLNLNDTFRKWRNTNMIEKLKSKEKVKSKTDVAQRILRVWKLSKLDSFNKWRQINQVRGLQQRITIHQKGNLIKLLNGLMEHNKINCLRQMIGRFRIHRNVVMIKRHFMKKLLTSRCGLVVTAFRKIQALPHRRGKTDYKEANKFEKGLDKWITDKLKYAFDQFKLEKEYGNVLKKRGIVVIAKTTQSKIRKTYDRWYEIAKKNQLVTQCKLITTTFSSLNWVIKSITDNILVNVLHKSQKEGALDKLFKNMHLNLNDTFRKWRNTNMIEKLKSKEKVKSKTDVAQRILRVWKLSKLDSFNKWRQINQVRGLQQRITIHQKGNLIKLLNGLMEHNKINCLRQMIGRFRIHRNVVMIKRHFMKKLLTSRCGLVVTAFRKIQALPHRRGKTDYKEANKFEKGLDKWITDKLKYAFDQFKLEKEYGNVLKKRGIVVIAKTTQSKIRKTYDRWYEIAKKNQLVTQCKLITTTFSSLNWVIKSITDNILVNVLHKSQKEGALDKLFKNMHLNLNDTFRKWRNTNMIEKLKSKEKVKSKTDVAQRILRVWKLSKLDSFNKWRQINQVRGLQQRITIHQKGNLIKLLNGLMEHNKINCLRQMIGRFRIHRNVVMIKRHFMKKLLTSRCGLVVTAFRKIQALPHRRGKTDYKEANKFEKGLDKWITDKLKYAFDQFKLEKEYGNVLKKRGIVVIAKTTQSKIRKTYDRWYEIAKKNQLVTQCKLITTTFSSLNWVIKSITDNILVNVLHKSQKEGALDKLFKNMHLNLNDTFRKWRNTNMIEKLKSKEKVKSKTDVAQRILRVWKLSKLDSFNKWRQINQVRGLQQRITIHQKGNLIKLLNGLMEHNKINCLRQMIGRFRIHRNVVMIKRHFMKKLLTSRCGLVVTAFRKIQALPHRRGKTDYKEANKFEKGLDKWITDKLKYAFDQFKLEKEYGNVLKKRGIVVIAKTTQSKIRKTYDRWYEIAKKNQLVTQCKLITTTFSSLNWVIKSITDNILVNVLHKSQKEGALDKLFKNMHLNLNDTFRKWRNTNMIEKLKSKEKVKSKTDVAQRILRVWKLSKLDSFNKWRQINQVRGLQQRITIHQKGNLIKLLNGLMEHNKINCLRQMIGRFRIHRNVVMIKRHFMKKLLTSRCGLVVTAFRKIQALPHRRGKTDYKEANKFEKGLDKWITDKLKYAFDQFKLEKEYGNVLKKRGIVVIAKTTQSKIRKIYDRWYFISFKLRHSKLCADTIKLFNTIQTVVKFSAQPLMRPQNYSKHIQHAIVRIYKNQTQNVHQSFKTWHELMLFTRKRRLCRQRTQGLSFQNFMNVFNSFHSSRIKQIVSQFRINSEILSIKKSLILRIIKNRISNLQTALKSIKHITVRNFSPKAILFADTLQKILLKNAHKSINKFKTCKVEALVRKRNSVLLIFSNQMSAYRESFRLWRSSNETTRIYKRAHMMEHFMQRLSKIEARNLSIVISKRLFSPPQLKLLNTVFSNWNNLEVDNLRQTFTKWWNISRYLQNNPWLKRASNRLGLNSFINMQKSLWRLKQNTLLQGNPFTSLKIVKLKKMFNTLRKWYEFNLAKSFWMIESHRKYALSSIDRGSFSSREQGGYEINRYDSVKQFGTESAESLRAVLPFEHPQLGQMENVATRSRKVALETLVRYVNAMRKESFDKWMFAALPQRRAVLAKRRMVSLVPEYYSDYTLKVGAADKILEVIASSKVRCIFKAFKAISEHSLYIKGQQAQKINKQQAKSPKITQSQKDQNQYLLNQLKLANDTILALQNRINKMVMQQAQNQFQNQGLDRIIDTVNTKMEASRK